MVQKTRSGVRLASLNVERNVPSRGSESQQSGSRRMSVNPSRRMSRVLTSKEVNIKEEPKPAARRVSHILTF